MFDLFAKMLSSLSTFLFPVFASYKALKSSDPAQLTPWLMYWVVLACLLLVESWTEWFLSLLPFYAWIRAFFLLYLVLPQTQGARLLYQSHVHPFLASHEASIDNFISSLHDRAKAAGVTYLRSALAFLKEHLLGIPPSPPSPKSSSPSRHLSSSSPTSYASSLLARFNVPAARPTPSDFYTLLTSFLNPSSPTLIPSDLHTPEERLSYVATQRERLRVLLRALDQEASDLSTATPGMTTAPAAHAAAAEAHVTLPGSLGPELAAGSIRLPKRKSDSDFETVDAEGVGEEKRTGSGGWMPWGWGKDKAGDSRRASSSGVEMRRGS
ncbi:MAG: hypothetical protein M1833_005551 [Piccolia ochrophora]|nr:MAG: hypothetical protein M1833_005551 [Piccolia ochrophora]